MQTREDWRLVLRHLLDGFEYAGEKLSAETIAALIEEAGRKGVVDEVVRAAERGGGWGGRYRVLRMDSQEKVVGITYWLVRSVMDRGWDGPAPLAHSSIQSAAAPAAGEAEGPASHGNTESEGQQQQPDHRTLLGWGLAQTRRVADLVELPSHAPPKGAPRPWKPLSRDPLVLAGPLHMAAVGMLVHGGGGHQAAAEFRQWLEYYAAKLVRAWLPPSSSSAGNEVARGGGIRGQYPEALFARHGELEYLDVAANPGRFVRYAATFLHAIDAASRCVADDKVRARIADEIRPHVRDEVLEALEIVANGEGRGSADGTGKGKVAAGWTIGPRTFVSFFGPDSLHHRLTGGDSPECRAAGELIAKMPPLPVAEAK